MTPLTKQTITDLDDFLTPSQACIIPVRQTNKVAGQETGVNGDVSILSPPLLRANTHQPDGNSYRWQ